MTVCPIKFFQLQARAKQFYIILPELGNIGVNVVTYWSDSRRFFSLGKNKSQLFRLRGEFRIELISSAAFSLLLVLLITHHSQMELACKILSRHLLKCTIG